MRKLPHPERTIVNIDKLTSYCLNPEHSDGQHKARVFKSALNIGIEDVELLKTALLNAVHQNVAIPTKRNAYGEKYIIDFEMNHSGQTAMMMKLLDTVALMVDMPALNLYRGQVGTIVEEYEPGIFEVEFSDLQGRMYALETLEASQLMRLRHQLLEERKSA